jgi:hypothetical protein
VKLADFKAPAVALSAFALSIILYFWARPVYDLALTWWGIEPFQSPFLDTGAIIAAVECSRHGVDVYLSNPCDVLGRLHVYAPLWLAASVLPVTGSWTTPVGLALDVAFLGSLGAIPAPVERRHQWMLIAAVLSTMSVYALERANSDLVTFLLLLAAGLLMARSSSRYGLWSWRWCAYPLILLAAFLKFYPIVGLLVSLRERGRIFLVVNFLSLLAVLIFLAAEAHDIARTMAIIPTGSYFTDWFGARNLPFGIADLIYRPSWEPLVRLLPPVLLVILGSRALWLAIALARRPALSTALSELPEREKLLLIIGAAVVTGCFFAGHNVGYRGIFLIMVLPGLLSLGRLTEGDESGRLCSGTAKLIIFVMWSEALRHAIVAARPLDLPAWHNFEAAFWIARELMWWRIVAIFAGILFRFVLSSTAAWRGLAPEHAAMGVPTS